MGGRVRANVYFDGFNFYYSCFRNRNRPQWRAYKWLDLHAFITKVFPAYSIGRIRYFTAPVRPDPDDPDQAVRQQIYFRALQTLPGVTLHMGRFALRAKYRRLADPRSFEPPFTPLYASPMQSVGIIQEEEKGSDVNLASYLLLDAFRDEYDIAIVVSNDSDLAEPIRLVRSELGRRIALLNPRKNTAAGLQGLADIQRVVRFGPIKSSQFAEVLRDDSGEFRRPDGW
jgi:uncharacterized LabA/DUF88 family protein